MGSSVRCESSLRTSLTLKVGWKMPVSFMLRVAFWPTKSGYTESVVWRACVLRISERRVSI